METVNIDIPASIYVKLYKEYGESTRDHINRILERSEEKDLPQLEDETADYVQTISYRPGPGTITGKVWDIADALKAKSGEASREAVVKACMEEGVKMNTASTQYSQWKKENG